MIDVTFKLKSARYKDANHTTWVTLEGQEESEWMVDTQRPGTPEGFVALQHWCSGSYRWASAEAIEKLLEQSK